MNYLILGGNGYLGSKITKTLIQEGHTVVCTKRDSSNLSRLIGLSDSIHWIPATDNAVETTMRQCDFDCVLNMVCNYGKKANQDSETIKSNLVFPLNVLISAVQNGIKKILTIGTSLPYDINMYSFTKKMLSDFGRFYACKNNISFSNIVLEMFYGYDEPKDRFIPSLITKMINGETVKTTLGLQKRDIIAVDDVISAIHQIIKSEINGYNDIPVGTGEAPTISELIDYIWEKTGCKSVIQKGVIPMREKEPDCVADTSILRELGYWNPIPWKDGILNMIKKMENSNETIN